MRLWSGWAHTLRTKESRRKVEKKVVVEVEEAKVGGEGKVKKGEENDEEMEQEKKNKEETAIINEDNDDEEDDDGEEEDEKEEEHSVPKESSSIMRPHNIQYREMAKTGKMVKRIFDQGRVEYLRKFGLIARQINYCDSVLSPECVMIMAIRQDKENMI